MTADLFALRPYRTRVLIAFDVAVWLASGVLAALLRYPNVASAPMGAVVLMSTSMAVLYVAVGMLVRLHEGRARTASFDEMFLIGSIAFLSGSSVFVVNLFALQVARSLPAIATLCFVVLALLGRATWRGLAEHGDVVPLPADAAAVLLVGAGEAARELIGSMLRDPARKWRPVGMLDDDPRKQHLRVRGVAVLGPIADFETQVELQGVTKAIFAIPSAGNDLVRDVTRRAAACRVELKVLPAVTELLTEHVGIRDIRDVNIMDFLGRNQIDTDITVIAGYLKDKRVLVTGAGGSIGSELCRQIDRFQPAELIMLDRDESALHAVQLSLRGRALLDSDDVVLCDIRDSYSLARIFRRRRPDVVFHAAALKHLPMLEQYPDEAIKTNVMGTRNVLEAATGAGVGSFVNISTDKAANPCSVLGYSKRIAERMTASYADDANDASYVSVRFGNVLGSRGSVLSSFADQISRGGPVTVTHPDVTRYFMTIEEACQLVVQAGAIGRPRQALILDMGEAVRIVDVAEQLIDLSDREIDIEFTGLRQGEKLHEDLFGDGEPHDIRPDHPLISHVPVPAVAAAEVSALPTTGSARDVTAALAALCLEKSPLPAATRAG